MTGLISRTTRWLAIAGATLYCMGIIVLAALIMMGDFNTGDREPGHAALMSELHDAFGETGWGFGFTFPNHKRMGPITIPVPLVRIDYIWTRGSVVPVASHVNCDDGGSDHCMVIADLRIEG